MKLPLTLRLLSLMTMKAGDIMKKLSKVLIILFVLFIGTVIIYWFNLDTKLVKALEQPLMKHYDSIPRDHRL